MSSSHWRDFASGLKATLPLGPSVAPFGMLYGTIGLAAGMSPLLTQLMSSVVFAGSSQFLAVQLVVGGAPALVVLLTTLVVNLRHALYGMSLSSYFKRYSSVKKAFMSYFMTDEAYAVSVSRFQKMESGDALEHPDWYYLGSGITLWTIWQVSTAVGVLFGSLIPDSWSLDFAVPLTFIALVVPNLTGKSEIIAALAAGLAAVLLVGLPLKLGIIAASMVGIFVGMAIEIRSNRTPTPMIKTPEVDQ